MQGIISKVISISATITIFAIMVLVRTNDRIYIAKTLKTVIENSSQLANRLRMV